MKRKAKIKSARGVAYSKFLLTPFWKELSERKRRAVGHCEKCKQRTHLQAHHLFYRENWFDTKEEDLMVLCRICHAAAHGFCRFRRKHPPIMMYRDDPLFSDVLHRCHHLTMKLLSDRPLRPRDERFLARALKWYPPRKKDKCIQFHVRRVRRESKLQKQGCFNPTPTQEAIEILNQSILQGRIN